MRGHPSAHPPLQSSRAPPAPRHTRLLQGRVAHAPTAPGCGGGGTRIQCSRRGGAHAPTAPGGGGAHAPTHLSKVVEHLQEAVGALVRQHLHARSRRRLLQAGRRRGGGGRAGGGDMAGRRRGQRQEAWHGCWVAATRSAAGASPNTRPSPLVQAGRCALCCVRCCRRRTAPSTAMHIKAHGWADRTHPTHR